MAGSPTLTVWGLLGFPGGKWQISNFGLPPPANATPSTTLKKMAVPTIDIIILRIYFSRSVPGVIDRRLIIT